MSRQCTPRSFCSFYAIWLEMSPPCANEPPKKLVKYFSTPYVLYIYIYSCSTQSNPSHKMRPYNAASKVTNAFSELALCGAYASSYSSPIGQPCDLGTTWGRVSATSLERWRSIYGCLCKTGVDQHGKTEIELQTTS